MSAPVKKAQRSTRPMFGRAAPSKNLRLPIDLVVLVGEFVVYFPDSLRNYHVLLRFCQAGLTQQTVSNLVNLHRNWEKYPADANSICKFLEKTMRDGLGGPRKWTTTRHKNGEFTYDYVWDAQDLTMNGVLLDCEVEPSRRMNSTKVVLPVEGIPFAHLARNVTVHPSYKRGDGFMLTRCVQYAAAHPEKNYVFPRDFEYLVRKLNDGRELRQHHLDADSIARWQNKKIWDANENPEIETFDDVVDTDDEADETDEAFNATLELEEEVAEDQNPLGLLDTSSTGNENTSSTPTDTKATGVSLDLGFAPAPDSYHGFTSAHASHSYNGFVSPAQSLAMGNVYASSGNIADLPSGNLQGLRNFRYSPYLNALYRSSSQVNRQVRGNLHSVPGFGQAQSKPPIRLHPSPNHEQVTQTPFYTQQGQQTSPQPSHNQRHHQTGNNRLLPQPGHNQLRHQPGYHQPSPHPGYSKAVLQASHSQLPHQPEAFNSSVPHAWSFSSLEARPVVPVAAKGVMVNHYPPVPASRQPSYYLPGQAPPAYYEGNNNSELNDFLARYSG
jgi:hypothetical protein